MTQKSPSESDIFRAAVKLTTARRAAFLDEACRGNRPLRDEVESLLRAHEPEGSFLQSPAVAITIDKPISERPGSIIGPYKLREQIGEGGFGVVYVAEQEQPVRRKVALKIIKPGMDTKDVIARFEAERQALALMDHPNVARVLDAGATESGRPYFVMELVQGVTITDFCDKNSLPTRERLALFADVCRAVQHAHQKGIIHRDLKPSNIMVTLHDGKPVAKVIDFGVSKALSQQLTEKSIYTAYGQMIGTPSYMSPEQAEMSGLGIDTRSDIYSLGVLLYELLTGQTPLDARRLRSSAYAEILRIIREEEPPRPSLKISTLGEQATAIAQQRHTDPKQLRRDLSGELDWIVMKCLEKDRARRYETAIGLARDIERYLRDEPVEACPPSLRYRLGKVLRKHRGPAIAAGLVVLALLAGIVGTSLGLVRANAERRRAVMAEQAALVQARKAEKAAAEEAKQRKRADEEAAAAKAVRSFLQDDLLRQASLMQQVVLAPLATAGSEFKENPTIRELLERAAAQVAPDKIDQKFPNLPLVQAEVLKAIGDAYAVEPSKAIEPLQRAVELYRQARGPDDPATLAARHSLGLAYHFSYKPGEAAQILEAVHKDRERVLGPTHPDTFTTREFLGMSLLFSQGPSAAIPYFQRLKDDARRAFGEDDLHHAFATMCLGIALTKGGRTTEAIQQFEATFTIADRLKIPTDHPYRLMCDHSLALAYYEAKQFAKAIPRFEKLLSREGGNAGDKSMVWETRHSLGWCYEKVGRRDEAIAAFEKNLTIAKPPSDILTMQALAWVLRDKDLERALALYKQARTLRAERGAADDEREFRVARQEIDILRSAGRTDEALALLDEVIPRMEKLLGEGHLEVLKILVKKARCLASLKQIESADEIFRKTIAQLEKSPGPNHVETLEARYSWLIGLRDCGQYERVIEMADEVAAQFRAAGNPTRVADVLFQKGSNLNRVGRPADGEPALREALAIYLKETPQAWNTANCKYHLGAGLASQRKFAEAEQLLLSAFDEMTERIKLTPAWGGNHRSLVAASLVKLYTDQQKNDEAAKWQMELNDLRAPASAGNE
jgi:eukaryotic-like serine/threonine-protein kinase